jgi:hypothetical protein
MWCVLTDRNSPATLIAWSAALFLLQSPTTLATAANLVDTANCGVAYDKATSGTPPAAFMDPELAHEIFAARDCTSHKNFATACVHYARTIAVLGRLSSDFAAEQRRNRSSDAEI